MRAWTILAAIPALCATACWLIVLATLMPGAPWFGFGPVLVLFLGIFPFHFAAVFISRRNSEGAWWSPWRAIAALRVLSRRQRAAGAAAFIAAWLCVMATAATGMGMRGQPTEINGRYYQEVGDDFTPITADRYRSEMAAAERSFAAGAAGMYAASATFLLSSRRRAIARSGGDDVG